MSVSDDIAAQIYALYHIDGDPWAAASNFIIQPGMPGTPDASWDYVDTVGVGKKFSVGSLVQNPDTNVLYRCTDATPGAAIWRIMVQEELI